MPLPEEGSHEGALYDSPPAFSPYDKEQPASGPEPVQPTSDSPARSSTTPGFGGTSGADGDPRQEPQDQPQEAPDPLPEFDVRHRDDFEGLLYLGKVEEKVSLWGHDFIIRTLTTEQLAEISLIVKPYMGTPAVNAVYQAAMVAAGVVAVDGKPLPSSIEVDDSMELTNVRYPYVLRKWLPPVREGIYNQIFDLELRVRKVLDEMGKGSG